MKTKRDLISTIKIDRANLSYIEKTGVINGTLLIEIERIMEEYRNQPLPEQTESAEECAGHSKISPTYTNHQPTYTGTIDYRLLEKAIRDNCNIEYSRTTGEEVVNSSLSAVCIAVEEYAQSHQVEMPSDEEIEKEYPTDLNVIKIREGFKSMSYEAEKLLGWLRTINLHKQEGAKWFKSKIK